MVTRVLIFSTDDHLMPAGGAEQAFGNIASRLPHIEFDLICAKLRRNAKSYEKIGNIAIHRIGLGIPRVDGVILALCGHIRARALMRTHTYDLMWSIMASYGAFAAVRVKKRTKVPILLTLQEGDSFEHINRRTKFIKPLFNEIFKTADGLQAISRYLLQWGTGMGYRGDLGTVIPNGVAIDAFTKSFAPEEIHRQRAAFGFAEDACVLFTSSRLERKNGIGDVITALSKLPEHFCLVICGSGSLETALKKQVAASGLDARVKFLGFVDPAELPLLMKASDIFIRPSLTEGLGTAFLEAMAAGLVTVGTNAGGIPDFLTDGQTGYLVGIEDPDSIVRTILRIESLDGQMRAQILNSARTLVAERFNWEVVACDMETLFTNVARS